MPHARLLSRGIAHASLGATCDREWDAPRPLDLVVREELEFWRDEVLQLAQYRMPMVPPTTGDIKWLWEELAPDVVWVRPLCPSADRPGADCEPWYDIYFHAAGLRQGHTFYLQQAPGDGAVWFAVEGHAKVCKWHLGPCPGLEETAAGAFTCACLAEVSLSPAVEPGNWLRNIPGETTPAGFVVVRAPGAARPPPPALQQLAGKFKGRLVTDARPLRWGASLTLPDCRMLQASDFYRQEDVSAGRTAEQPWREGYAALLSVEAFSQELADGVVLHHSDCVCVVNARWRARALRSCARTLDGGSRWISFPPPRIAFVCGSVRGFTPRLARQRTSLLGSHGPRTTACVEAVMLTSCTLSPRTQSYCGCGLACGGTGPGAWPWFPSGSLRRGGPS